MDKLHTADLPYFNKFIDTTEGLSSKLSFVRFIGERFQAKTRVVMCCEEHGNGDEFSNPWLPIVSSVMSGFGCPKCAGKYNYTETELIRLIEGKGYVFHNFVGEFIGQKTCVNLICKIHGEGSKFPNPWEPTVTNVLRDKGCPKCSFVYQRTKDEWINLVNQTGYTFQDVFSVFNGKKSKIIVSCEKHGRGDLFDKPWLPTLEKITSGSGCPKCSKLYHFSEDEYIRQIEEKCNYKVLEFIKPWKSKHTKVNVLCSVHGEGKNYRNKWLPTINNLLRGAGCPKCQDKYVYTPEEIIDKIELITPYKFVKFLSDYGWGVKNKVIVACPNQHSKDEVFQWETYPTQLFRGVGCPVCAESGFNKGKSAYFYLQNLYLDDKLIALKIGITNNPPELRMAQQNYKSKLSHELVNTLFSVDGAMIYDFERKIHSFVKKSNGTSFISKDLMPDGYTETVSPIHRFYIINEMKKFKG